MFWKQRVYLDYASGVNANASSPHEEGRRAKKILEDARTSVARLIEVQADDVIFTSGATESNALAILGLARSGSHMLYLPSAHASVVENMKLARERGVDIEPLPIRECRVDTEKLGKMLRTETVLVSMDAVCGETGVIWNTREVANVLNKFRTGRTEKSSARAARPIQHDFSVLPVLHVDASQAPLTEKITRAHFGADLLTLDGSKVGAARGSGVLVAHRTIPLSPLYRGGGQERGLRPGSESPESAREMAACLRQAATGREKFQQSAKRARENLVSAITKQIRNVSINEAPTDRQAPHIVNLSLPGRDTDYLVMLLDEAGFAVSTRSACETDSEEGSRAVYALFGDTERARSTLRISWGPDISTRALDRLADALIEAVAFVDNVRSR